MYKQPESDIIKRETQEKARSPERKREGTRETTKRNEYRVTDVTRLTLEQKLHKPRETTRWFKRSVTKYKAAEPHSVYILTDIPSRLAGPFAEYYPGCFIIILFYISFYTYKKYIEWVDGHDCKKPSLKVNFSFFQSNFFFSTLRPHALLHSCVPPSTSTLYVFARHPS